MKKAWGCLVVGLVLGATALGGADAAVAACPNEAFRAGLAAGLPECRAYEKVTPADKGGADAQSSPFGASPGGFQAAEDGEAAIYTTLNGVFADSQSAPATISYRGKRTLGGWVSQGIDPALEAGGSTSLVEHPFFTPDLAAQVIYTGATLVGGTPEGGIYRTGFEPRTFEQVAVADGSPASPESLVASTDARTIAYVESGSTIRFFRGGVLEEVTLPGGSNYRIGAGPPGFFAAGNVDTALSDDGARLYFTAQVGSSGPQIYLRQGGVSALVSQPNEGVPAPAGEKAAVFGWAAPDGSRAFLTSAAKLTADATTGPAEEGSDLYEYDLARPAGSRLVDLTPEPTSPAGARVSGVLGAGGNGAYVYFTATGSIGGEGTAGQTNLYVHHAGATRFIAAVEPGELLQQAIPIEKKFDITSDGAHLVFQTTHPQPGYDNAGHSEIYLYDAEGGSLRCASCFPAGTAATADSSISESTYYLFNGPVHMRNVSDDGRHVFFNSGSALVPTDTNGVADVYEFSDGVPRLISTGTAAEASLLLGDSADGRDVFFGTRQRLTASDQDDIVDVYDARIEGGLVEPIPGAGPSCGGEAECRPPLQAPTTSTAPGSSSFQGPGNPPPQKKKAKAKPKPKRHRKHRRHRHHRKQGHKHSASTADHHRGAK